MSKTRHFELVIIAFLANLLVRLIFFTCKKSYSGTQNLEIQDPIIISMWHGELLMVPFFYNKFRQKNVYAMISDHKDGELISQMVSFLRIKSIRGSSSRGNIKVLKAALKTLKNKDDIAITPDGPKGPRHSVANGIIDIAQKTALPIVAIRVKCKNAWRFSSWDKHLLPKPFSHIEYSAKRLEILKDTSLETAKKTLQNTMGVDDYADKNSY